MHANISAPSFKESSPHDLPAEALLSAIIDSSEDAIVSMTLDGTITSWNASAERIFGYRAYEAVGQNVSFLVPPEMEEEQRDIRVRVQAGERVKHYETTRIGKGTKYIGINLTVSPVRNDIGQIIGASMIAQDITEKTIIEANLKTYLGELEDSNKKLA